MTGTDYVINHDTNWSEFSYTYTCFIIFAIAFAMVLPKDVSLYNKINSFGVIFIFIILVFELGVGIFSLTNTTYPTDKAVYNKYMDEREAGLNPSYVAYI